MRKAFTPLEISKMRVRKKFLTGFTLLELLIVVIIIGVLAAVALVQYREMSERARATEAKVILAHIRSAEQIYYERWDTYTEDTGDLVVVEGSIPSVACDNTSFFTYDIFFADATQFVVNATRCTSGGKSPNWPTAYFISINQNGEVVSPYR